MDNLQIVVKWTIHKMKSVQSKDLSITICHNSWSFCNLEFDCLLFHKLSCNDVKTDMHYIQMSGNLVELMEQTTIAWFITNNQSLLFVNNRQRRLNKV